MGMYPVNPQPLATTYMVRTASIKGHLDLLVHSPLIPDQLLPCPNPVSNGEPAK